jgi:hypothetical protein
MENCKIKKFIKIIVGEILSESFSKQEKLKKIKQINLKYNKDYKLADNGRIYSVFREKKQWYNIDELIKRWGNFEREKNANINAKKTCEFLEKNGGELFYKSTYGSNYYHFHGYKVRVSNHDWISEKYTKPDINLCSYEVGGYEEMIKELKKMF